MNINVWIDKLRVWLNNNKIFFETITVVLLAIMAIIVSLEANRIASYQTEIMKSENLPILHLDVAQIYDPNTKNYTHDQLIISNVGAPLKEFDYKTAIFFKIRYGQPPDELKTALIPLNAYYPTGFVTNNPTGELARLVNYEVTEGNNYKAAHIIWDFSDFAREREYIGLVDLVRYVKVRYKDKFGDTHIEFYSVAPMRTYRLNEIEGTQIFNEYEDNIWENGFDFYSEILPNSIYEKWSIIVNKSKVHTK